VMIFVAGEARGRKPQVRAIRIFNFDCRTLLGRNVRSSVALLALQSSVLAFQQVTCVLVVEGLDIPLDQGEVFAVMLRVAAGALLAGTLRDVIGRVQALSRRHP